MLWVFFGIYGQQHLRWRNGVPRTPPRTRRQSRGLHGPMKGLLGDWMNSHIRPLLSNHMERVLHDHDRTRRHHVRAGHAHLNTEKGHGFPRRTPEFAVAPRRSQRRGNSVAQLDVAHFQTVSGPQVTIHSAGGSAWLTNACAHISGFRD